MSYSRYTPQHLNLDYKFKPFIPDYIPAVGDIDAFLKVVPPERMILGGESADFSNLGLIVLDEPAANQSDSALLHLQLRAVTVTTNKDNKNMVIFKRLQLILLTNCVLNNNFEYEYCY